MQGSWNSFQNQAECLSAGPEGPRKHWGAQGRILWQEVIFQMRAVKADLALNAGSMTFFLDSFCKSFTLSSSVSSALRGGTPPCFSLTVINECNARALARNRRHTNGYSPLFPVSCRASPTFFSPGQFCTLHRLMGFFVLQIERVTSEDHIIFPPRQRERGILPPLFLLCSPATPLCCWDSGSLPGSGRTSPGALCCFHWDVLPSRQIHHLFISNWIYHLLHTGDFP